MRVRIDTSIFGDGAFVSVISGDMDFPVMPNVGDWIDIRRGMPGLMRSEMPKALLVTDVGEFSPDIGGCYVCFEYFETSSVESAFEVCRLLQDELDLFCDTPLPHGDKYGDEAD